MNKIPLDQRFQDLGVPEHTADALVYYLLEGCPPSGFLTSVLLGNLFNAVTKADYVNRNALWHITKAIQLIAPENSYGSEENIKAWCDPNNKNRLTYKTSMEKEIMWSKLETL